MDSQSLTDEHSLASDSPTPLSKLRTRKTDFRIIFFIVVSVLAMATMAVLQNLTLSQTVTEPIKIQLPWHDNTPITMLTNTSRVLQPLFYSGHDDRRDPNYKTVTKKQHKWSVQPQGIVSVDMYGRINALIQGKCIIKVISLWNESVYDQRDIVVVDKVDGYRLPKKVIKYQGKKAKQYNNLQKIVIRYSAGQQIQNSTQIPDPVKQASLAPQKQYQKTVIVSNINWTICRYIDQSPRSYLLRTDTALLQQNRDKYQYFIGDRYLPGDGSTVVMVADDGDNGVWVVSDKGDVNHIQMVKYTYREKANIMLQQTKKCVLRHGIAAGATKVNNNSNKCIPQISDNDGLWTAIYGAGQLMKYSTLRSRSTNTTQINQSRTDALQSLKAVLMIANVAGRQGRVNAKIRHLTNTYSGEQGVRYSKQYLNKGKYDMRDIYVGTPADGVGLFGKTAQQLVQSLQTNQHKYTVKYTMHPFNQQDWSTSGQQPATTQRSLSGFMARTFVIPDIDPPVPTSGLFFRRTNTTTHHVLSGAHTLYQYTDSDHPSLELGNLPIPQALRSYLHINNRQYNAQDLVYKGDTSTDEVIGHLFIYKIGYDILSEQDPQQQQLKQLIRHTLRQFSQTLINNGYTMPDATGQATKWTKLYKEFLNSDFTQQDASLKALQILLTFKLTYYVTGQLRFKQQYQLLANDYKFKYLQLVSLLWQRWVNIFAYTGDRHSNDNYNVYYNRNVSQMQKERHTIYQIHFSDEEEAFLGYYLAFQLQDNPEYIKCYRKGIDSYWHSISSSQNPLWYYIYQLTQPYNQLYDHYNNSLIQIGAWQLNRHVVDTSKYQAYVQGSRGDIIIQGTLSTDPSNVIGRRVIKQDAQYVNNVQQNKCIQGYDPYNIYQLKVLPGDQRSVHKYNGASFDQIDRNHNGNDVQASTTYTVPYWFGVYHQMLDYN